MLITPIDFVLKSKMTYKMWKIIDNLSNGVIELIGIHDILRLIDTRNLYNKS
jgi:hypothetical protein